jgi:hypothetical protein
MSKPDLSERDAAIAATIARRTLREDRRDAEREARNAPSRRTVIISVLFVLVASLGGLALMIAMQ